MRFFYSLLSVASMAARLAAAFSAISFADSSYDILGVDSRFMAMGWAIFLGLALLLPELRAEALQQSSGAGQYRRYAYGRDIDGGKHFDASTWNSVDNPSIYGTPADPINRKDGLNWS